ncbi:hypothetical protein ACFV5G_02760 [Streptomyces sp. NPDC059766]|uniref:hypothetical protein n=1 Tax=Streptomyces sp. NPDC059766 TaxID=3346940 RepID=UPI003649C88A
MFDRSGQVDEPPVPTASWSDVWEFAIGDEERPAGGRRSRPVLGVRAFRVPSGSGAQRVNAPCAFFPPGATTTDLCLYEDAQGRSLLCRVDGPETKADVRDYRIRDAQGQVIGTVRRVRALRHALKPTWRIEQPGRPEIVSGTERAATDGVTEFVQRGAGRLLLGAVQAVADLGADGGDRPAGARLLEWRADGEPVMSWDGRHRFLIRASWFDRRLAFAFALLRAG